MFVINGLIKFYDNLLIKLCFSLEIGDRHKPDMRWMSSLDEVKLIKKPRNGDTTSVYDRPVCAYNNFKQA